MIELVGEFVIDQVMPIVDSGGTGAHMIPRKHDGTVPPRLSQPDGTSFSHHSIAHLFLHRGDERARVDDHRAQAGIMIVIAVQNEQACLGRYRHPYLIIYFHTAGAFENLLRHEHLYFPLQRLAISIGQTCIQGKIHPEDHIPCGRKRGGKNFIAAVILEKIEHRSSSLNTVAKYPAALLVSPCQRAHGMERGATAPGPAEESIATDPDAGASRVINSSLSERMPSSCRTRGALSSAYIASPLFFHHTAT